MLKKYILMLLVCVALPAWSFSLGELEKQLQQPQNVHGNFVQQKYLKNMNKPISSQGQFVLAQNMGLLWQMKKPFVDTLRVRKNGIEQLTQGKWLAMQQNMQKKQIKLFLNLLGGHTVDLQSQFNMQLTGTPQNWKLLLQPKTALMKQIFTQIEIEGDSLVKKIVLAETQGDKTVMMFTNTKINVDLNEFEKNALLP